MANAQGTTLNNTGTTPLAAQNLQPAAPAPQAAAAQTNNSGYFFGTPPANVQFYKGVGTAVNPATGNNETYYQPISQGDWQQMNAAYRAGNQMDRNSPNRSNFNPPAFANKNFDQNATNASAGFVNPLNISPSSIYSGGSGGSGGSGSSGSAPTGGSGGAGTPASGASAAGPTLLNQGVLNALAGQGAPPVQGATAGAAGANPATNSNLWPSTQANTSLLPSSIQGTGASQQQGANILQNFLQNWQPQQAQGQNLNANPITPGIAGNDSVLAQFLQNWQAKSNPTYQPGQNSQYGTGAVTGGATQVNPATNTNFMNMLNSLGR